MPGNDDNDFVSVFDIVSVSVVVVSVVVVSVAVVVVSVVVISVVVGSVVVVVVLMDLENEELSDGGKTELIFRVQ